MYRCISVFAVALALLAGCAGPKQTAGLNDGAAPRNAEAIVVQTDTEQSMAYRDAAQVLQSQGYALENTDSELGSISTGWNGVSQRYGTDFVFNRLTVNVQEQAGNARIILRGQWRSAGEDGSGQTIRKYGQDGSPQREAWKAMHQTAEAIDGEIGYR